MMRQILFTNISRVNNNGSELTELSHIEGVKGGCLKAIAKIHLQPATQPTDLE